MNEEDRTFLAELLVKANDWAQLEYRIELEVEALDTYSNVVLVEKGTGDKSGPYKVAWCPGPALVRVMFSDKRTEDVYVSAVPRAVFALLYAC